MKETFRLIALLVFWFLLTYALHEIALFVFTTLIQFLTNVKL